MHSDLAVIEPILKQPTNPGATVDAIQSTSSILFSENYPKKSFLALLVSGGHTE